MNKDVYIINPFFRDTLKNIDISISDPITKENAAGKSVQSFCCLRFDSAEVTISPIKIEKAIQH